MSLRRRSAAILFNAEKLLLIHRLNHGRDYYVLPGGGIESDEDPETACRREVHEETGLVVTEIFLKKVLENQGHIEYYFLVKAVDGEPHIGGPETLEDSPQNWYLLEWVGITNLPVINLLPESARQLCLQLFAELENK